VRVNDPAGDVLLHLGSSNYLSRYKTYVGHVKEWRQQFQKLESVNLRYDNQVIVNPDMEGAPRTAALSAAAAKAAAVAGVKPAALVARVLPHEAAIPKPVFELSPKKLDPKLAAAKKPAVKAKGKTVAKPAKAPTLAAKNAARVGHPVAQKTVVKTQTAAPKPETKKLAQSAAPAANNAGSKPSPAIVKPPANN